MLKELSLKDSYWRKIALNICKDKDLADDLVQEMYLKLYDCEKQINDFYVILTIRSLFLDICRNKIQFVPIENINIFTDNVFEIEDRDLIFLNKLKTLGIEQQKILEENYYFSLRQLASNKNIGYQKVRIQLKNARKKILGEDMHLYNNKRKKSNGKT
jgi:DNA-directed RNA polymerase specialized sigma24 family protein